MLAVLIGAGLFDIGFAIFHLMFWRLFAWEDLLPRMGSVNGGILQILNLRLIFLFLAFGLAFVTMPAAFTTTSPGMVVLAIWALFWFMRAGEQIWFFGLKHRLSMVLFVLFLVGGLLHLLPIPLAWGVGVTGNFKIGS